MKEQMKKSKLKDMYLFNLLSHKQNQNSLSFHLAFEPLYHTFHKSTKYCFSNNTWNGIIKTKNFRIQNLNSKAAT